MLWHSGAAVSLRDSPGSGLSTYTPTYYGAYFRDTEGNKNMCGLSFPVLAAFDGRPTSFLQPFPAGHTHQRIPEPTRRYDSSCARLQRVTPRLCDAA